MLAARVLCPRDFNIIVEFGIEVSKEFKVDFDNVKSVSIKVSPL